MGADSWGSSGTVCSPLSVDQMVIFPNVIEVYNNVVVAEEKAGQVMN
jgi:hypothetical protein